ncbi:MAG: LysM peptidoglycan-binding domain-containing protein [Myxococcota bacterium]
MNSVQLKREGSPSPSSSPKEAGAPGSGGDLKKEMRGMSFEAQEARLAPGGGAVQKKEEAGAAMAKQGGEAVASTKKKDEGGSFGAADPGNRMAALHPTFVDYVKRVIDIAHGKGLDIMIVQGMRTIAEQNDLYAQGRTKGGKVVTWVRGGSSYHNYGLAADFAFHGKDPWSESHDWKGLVASVREAGLISGASYGDRPHCNLDVPMRSLQSWYGKGGLRNVWDHVSENYGGPRYPGQEGGGGADQGSEKKGPQTGGGGGGGYTVKPGDTLTEIAQILLGDSSRWQELAAYNGIKDPRDLAPGKVLKVPSGPAAKKKDDDSSAHQGGEAHFRKRSHTVVRGETLTSIAQKYYGVASLWTEIAMANEIKDPAALKVGQKLVIPTPDDKAKKVDTKKAVPMTHLVVAGETLGAIAQQHYGDASRWKEIAGANHIADPKALKIGTRLTIPA